MKTLKLALGTSAMVDLSRVRCQNRVIQCLILFLLMARPPTTLADDSGSAHGKEAIQVAKVPLLERVQSSWEMRQHAVSNISIDIEGVQVIPRGSMLDMKTEKPLSPPAPAEELRLPLHWKFLFDFQNSRHRFQNETTAYRNGSPIREYSISMFNGTDHFEQTIEGEVPSTKDGRKVSWGMAKGDMTVGTFPVRYRPIFWMQGSIDPEQRGSFKPGCYRYPPSTRSLFHKQDATFNGILCHVLINTNKTGMQVEYWVDQANHRLLVAREYEQGKLVDEFEMKYGFAGDPWLLVSWTYACYAPPGHLRFRHECSVRKIVQNAPELEGNQFEPNWVPGELVEVLESNVSPNKMNTAILEVQADGSLGTPRFRLSGPVLVVVLIALFVTLVSAVILIKRYRFHANSRKKE